MEKKLIRITETDLHNIVNESVRTILREAWENDYNAAMDKQDYLKKKEDYDSKAWYKKILALVSGNKPKDPNSGAELKDLLNNYVEAFNKEHGIGHRIDYGDGETFHSRMSYSSDDDNYGQPVLSATYNDGNMVTQSRKSFNDSGDETEWGVKYPYSEFGVTGDEAPSGSNPNVDNQYRKFNNNREEIKNVIRNRAKNKKQ